jgi:hypothetical protein
LLRRKNGDSGKTTELPKKATVMLKRHSGQRQ